MSTSPDELILRLGARGATLACAESLTGGLLCAELINVPGASQVIRGGVIAYATDVKETELGVDPELLRSSGAVNAAVAEQMADGVRNRLGATYGLSTTGVAGPQTQDGKPVGTVYVAVAGAQMITSRLLNLTGGREEIRRGAVAGALELLAETVAWHT